jgi:hypothetical protein
MKFIGRVLEIATVAWCIGFFFLPRRVVGVTMFGLLFVVGLWTVLYPQGMMEVAKTAHPGIESRRSTRVVVTQAHRRWFHSLLDHRRGLECPLIATVRKLAGVRTPSGPL